MGVAGRTEPAWKRRRRRSRRGCRATAAPCARVPPHRPAAQPANLGPTDRPGSMVALRNSPVASDRATCYATTSTSSYMYNRRFCACSKKHSHPGNATNVALCRVSLRPDRFLRLSRMRCATRRCQRPDGSSAFTPQLENPTTFPV